MEDIQSVEQAFDLSVFRIAAEAEGNVVTAFDNLKPRMQLWYMLDQFPSKPDLGAEIHAGYVAMRDRRIAEAKAKGLEPDAIVIPTLETCTKDYASGVLKFAQANEWPKGIVRSYGSFQKQSVSEGKRSGKGRPKGSTGSKKTETKPTKTETKPATPTRPETWRDLCAAFSIGVNKAPALPVRADDKATLRADDAARVQDLLRQIIGVLAPYYDKK